MLDEELAVVKVKVPQWCLTLCRQSMKFSRPEYWSDSHSLLQGIFPTQGLNPGLPHCRQILYQLSHKGSPRILEWVAYPFSSRSSWPRNSAGVSCIAGGFFTNWATREVGLRWWRSINPNWHRSALLCPWREEISLHQPEGKFSWPSLHL